MEGGIISEAFVINLMLSQAPHWTWTLSFFSQGWVSTLLIKETVSFLFGLGLFNNRRAYRNYGGSSVTKQVPLSEGACTLHGEMGSSSLPSCLVQCGLISTPNDLHFQLAQILEFTMEMIEYDIHITQDRSWVHERFNLQDSEFVLPHHISKRERKKPHH